MLLYYLLTLSVVALALYGYDKLMAKQSGWRVSEKALLTVAVLGGAWGALAGMLLFRHKTRHLRFWLIVGAAALLYLGMWLTSVTGNLNF